MAKVIIEKDEFELDDFSYFGEAEKHLKELRKYDIDGIFEEYINQSNMVIDQKTINELLSDKFEDFLFDCQGYGIPHDILDDYGIEDNEDYIDPSDLRNLDRLNKIKNNKFRKISKNNKIVSRLNKK